MGTSTASRSEKVRSNEISSRSVVEADRGASSLGIGLRRGPERVSYSAHFGKKWEEKSK